jgi:hypothetical protein
MEKIYEQIHQLFDFICRPTPVLGRKSIHGHVLDPAFNAHNAKIVKFFSTIAMAGRSC